MNSLYVAGFCLVAAQLLGVYALVTRKADLIFAMVMGVLLAAALVIAGYYGYHKLH